MQKTVSLMKKAEAAAPWIFLAAGYIFTIAFFALSGKAYMIGDDCSEWVLADHLAKTGRIVSADWFYGTELHVFFSQILNKWLIRIFSDWHAARTVSVAVFLAVTAAAVLVMTRAAGLGRNGIYAAAALTFPIGKVIGYFTIISGFYNFYLALLMWILAIHALLLSDKKRSKWNRFSLMACAAVLAFLSGLNGVRFLIVLYFPLFLTAFLYAWNKLRLKQSAGPDVLLKTEEIRHFLFVCAESFACAAGWVINEKFLSSAFSFLTYKNNNLHTFRFSEFLDYFSDFFYIFGYEGIQDFSSYRGIGQLFGLIMNMLLICLAVYCVRHRKEFSRTEGRYLTFAALSIFSNTLVFYLGQQAEKRFLVLAACQMFVVAAIAFRNMERTGDLVRRRLAILLFALCLFAEAFGYAYGPGLVFERGRKTQEEEIADWLVSEGYTHGMSSFYPGSYVEYLSSGKVEMWILSDDTGDESHKGMSWEQVRAHLKAPSDNHAALIVGSDRDQFTYYTDHLQPVYETQDYQVFDIEKVTDIFTEQ